MRLESVLWQLFSPLKYSFKIFLVLVLQLSLQTRNTPTQTDILRESVCVSESVWVWKWVCVCVCVWLNGWEGLFGTQLFKKHNYKRFSDVEENCSVCCHLHRILDYNSVDLKSNLALLSIECHYYLKSFFPSKFVQYNILRCWICIYPWIDIRLIVSHSL